MLSCIVRPHCTVEAKRLQLCTFGGSRYIVFLGPDRRHQGGRGVHVPSSVFWMPMHPAPAAKTLSGK